MYIVNMIKIPDHYVNRLLNDKVITKNQTLTATLEPPVANP